MQALTWSPNLYQSIKSVAKSYGCNMSSVPSGLSTKEQSWLSKISIDKIVVTPNDRWA